MNTNALKRFAREARIKLLDQVGRKLEFVTTNIDPVFLDTNSSQINSLKEKIKAVGSEQVIETVAYTWFNRLMALRFMDANSYASPKVVTPVMGKTPELLQNALAGQVDENLVLNRQRLNELLDGNTKVSDAQTEAYKMLLIASCNYWHKAMPFMFERISDYTELLLPDDLLSEYSIIADIRNGMSDEDCQQEELIGWLYQFYIADKKDEVFDDLKKNIKITPENIPAATQLFTPRWIVRYMVENTLGKLWLTLKPNSKIGQHMPYYIEAPEGNAPAPFPEGVKGVTDITFLDPCQGSGHVLVYAFDLFAKIYEEEGYNTNEIPALILKHNLFGIDIDERAAQLAAFALTMKARSYFPRFLRNPVQPHVIALENVSEDIIKQAVNLPLSVNGKLVYDYRDLTLYNFTQADNLGSLIQIDPEELRALQIQKGSIWQNQEQKLKEQAEYLSRHYHCVVTNPPYMGGKGMNDALKIFIEKNYNAGKADLMTCFMQRCGDLICENCRYGMINLPSWLFLTSFEDLRKGLLSRYHIDSLLHMGRGIFGIDFGSVAFIISKSLSTTKGVYFRLHQRNFQHIYYFHIEQLFTRAKENPSFRYDFNDYRDEEGVSEIPYLSNPIGLQLHYQSNQKDFEKISGCPIGYWASPQIFKIFEKSKSVIDFSESKAGLQTGNNPKYLRKWFEISISNFNFEIEDVNEEIDSHTKWVPYNKGGGFRKWYGNIVDVLYWYNHNELLFKNHNAVVRNRDYYFKDGITWTLLSSTDFGVRVLEHGSVFDVNGMSMFMTQTEIDKNYILGLLSTKVVKRLLAIINPTLAFQVGDINKIPVIVNEEKLSEISKLVEQNISISRNDWNSSEISWDFLTNELTSQHNKSIKLAIENYKIFWSQKFNELHQNEESLNRHFIEIYGLQNELTSEILLKEITILQEDARIVNNELFINQTSILLKFVSYSIGCLFGRYSIDIQGLILANQGSTLQDFLLKVPNSSFMPDSDNIIPVLDGEWFNDDIVGRFRAFLKTSFGVDYFEDNLKYLEDTIGKDIRKYFVKDFYNDHIKRYKKRPIYWMFSSPKGHFKALIYMHRYQPDLCSKLLTDYLQTFINKLDTARQNQIALGLREDISAREKTAANKEVERLAIMIKDCQEYAQTLYAVATQKIAIDLDDGVKVNYQKFKDVLVPIKGLEKEEE